MIAEKAADLIKRSWLGYAGWRLPPNKEILGKKKKKSLT